MLKDTRVSLQRMPGLLRKEIQRRKLSQYRIAIETGIRQPSLSRFLNGGSLKMETAAVLLDYLGFQLVLPSVPKKASQSRALGKTINPSRLRNRYSR